MKPSVLVLTTAVEENRPFRAGSLVFQPSEAVRALEFGANLSGSVVRKAKNAEGEMVEIERVSAKDWFESQSVMRMVFLGNADITPAPLKTREKAKQARSSDEEEEE